MDKIKYKEKFAKTVCANCKYFLECFLDKNFKNNVYIYERGDGYITDYIREAGKKEKSGDDFFINELDKDKYGICYKFLKSEFNFESHIDSLTKKLGR